MQEQFLWISAIPMYRASKCTRDGSSWMWLAGHMQWQLFRLVWGMRAKFGLCYCVLNCKLLSVLPDNASCLCIRLCFTVSKINLSLQIRKSSTKQKKKKKEKKVVVMTEDRLGCLSPVDMPVSPSVVFVILLQVPMLALGWSHTMGSLVGPQGGFWRSLMFGYWLCIPFSLHAAFSYEV